MYNPFSLEGKTILITGASSGIGSITAIECSKMGATVILTGRNEERLIETFNSLHNKEINHKYSEGNSLLVVPIFACRRTRSEREHGWLCGLVANVNG